MAEARAVWLVWGIAVRAGVHQHGGVLRACRKEPQPPGQRQIGGVVGEAMWTEGLPVRLADPVAHAEWHHHERLVGAGDGFGENAFVGAERRAPATLERCSRLHRQSSDELRRCDEIAIPGPELEAGREFLHQRVVLGTLCRGNADQPGADRFPWQWAWTDMPAAHAGSHSLDVFTSSRSMTSQARSESGTHAMSSRVFASITSRPLWMAVRAARSITRRIWPMT